MARINWFPGHMAKTLRLLKEQLSACEFVIEVLDARLPEASQNPELASLLAHKQRLCILNKADLADPVCTSQALEGFKAQGIPSLACDVRKASDVQKILQLARSQNAERIARAKARGRVARPIRTLVAGIPNTGKSTLINGLCGKKVAKTANTPGVTRQLSWSRAGQDLLLLDSPGLLWPRFETVHEQYSLALSGAIRDDILPMEKVAAAFLIYLGAVYPEQLKARYAFDLAAKLQACPYTGDDRALWALERLCEAQGMKRQSGEADLLRMAKRLIQDFRSLKLGRISLEKSLPEGAK